MRAKLVHSLEVNDAKKNQGRLSPDTAPALQFNIERCIMTTNLPQLVERPRDFLSSYVPALFPTKNTKLDHGREKEICVWRASTVFTRLLSVLLPFILCRVFLFPICDFSVLFAPSQVFVDLIRSGGVSSKETSSIACVAGLVSDRILRRRVTSTLLFIFLVSFLTAFYRSTVLPCKTGYHEGNARALVVKSPGSGVYCSSAEHTQVDSLMWAPDS